MSITISHIRTHCQFIVSYLNEAWLASSIRGDLFLQIIHDDERDLSLSEDDDDEEDDESQGNDKNKEGRTSSRLLLLLWTF